jgi:hypothetical protein
MFFFLYFIFYKMREQEGKTGPAQGQGRLEEVGLASVGGERE